MKKYLLSLLCLLLVIAIAPMVMALDDIPLPKSFYDGDSHDSKTIGELTVTNIKAVAVTKSVTNGQTGVELAGFWNVISTGSGQTNTITLAAPGVAGVGRLAILQVSPSATNLLAIADSGTVNLTAAFSGGAGDVLFLIGGDTGTWYSAAGPANN